MVGAQSEGVSLSVTAGKAGKGHLADLPDVLPGLAQHAPDLRAHQAQVLYQFAWLQPRCGIEPAAVLLYDSGGHLRSVEAKRRSIPLQQSCLGSCMQSNAGFAMGWALSEHYMVSS